MPTIAAAWLPDAVRAASDEAALESMYVYCLM